MAKKKITTRSKSKSKAKPKKTKAKPKKSFGGYAISFKGRKDSVEKVFGSKPIAPSEMTKKIWAYVKANDLGSK